MVTDLVSDKRIPRRRTGLHPADRGFSLLETFIALILMAIMFFALVGLYPAAMGSIRRATHMMAASDVAQQALENAMLANDPTKYTPPPTTTVDGVEYTTVQTVTVLGSPGGRDLWQIQELVTWWSSDGSNMIESVTFQTVQYNFVNSR